MKYGCIGEHLVHSFSKEIHNALADYEYELREIERDNLDSFMQNSDFNAINVTIPYKELVIPHMYYVDAHAKEIGAVNTVVNRAGKLYGYNTDFYGMSCLLEHANIDIKDKKVAILGTGGTSKTAYAVSKALGAKEIIKVSRHADDDSVSYLELYEKHTDAEVIINTTPVGMYPKIYDSPIELSKFKNLLGVIDAIYNPLRTPLVLEAINRSIPAEGGLYMLVKQALRASEIFIDTAYSDKDGDEIFKNIMREKENIVLIGMPGSGKSTVGKILAKLYERPFIDTDALIEERAGKTISKIFEEWGESSFRALEHEIIKEAAAKNCSVISTGGGAVLNPNNISALRENGKVYFIDRPLSALVPTPDRPLALSAEEIKKRYEERYGIYVSAADERIDADCEVDSVVEKIKRSFG
ncbi:MAG: shikimate dehydrogenase [Ruminococcaceae bacterium]|nr:shikimate dehydrogenase [Oscillospiraceae bacterium]